MARDAALQARGRDARRDVDRKLRDLEDQLAHADDLLSDAQPRRRRADLGGEDRQQLESEGESEGRDPNGVCHFA